MRTVELHGGLRMPVLGQGTWMMGDRRHRAEEVAALRLGLELGTTLVDTAEMYGDGGAEEAVGEALAAPGVRRDEVFLVTKVLPTNASRKGTVKACERSLKRLRTDVIDLYLLHWPGSHPVADTVAAFEELRDAGKIRSWGVSNFDVHELEEVAALGAGARLAADQVFYSVKRRGIERRLVPWCAARGVTVMAYSPLEQGRLPRSPRLDAVARRHGVTPAQVLVAFTIRLPGFVTIPKASRPEHVRQNAAAADLALTAEDLADLDAAFPRPARDVPLETA